MTRNEIIQGLQFTIDMFLLNPTTGETYTEPRNDMDKTTIDACRGAIELLEEPRKDEIILTKKEYGELVSSEFDNGYAKGFREALEQEPKTDNWSIKDVANTLKKHRLIAEQEHTLDKIREEIDIARFIDKDTKLCKNANASGLEVALQIIDKYKESEGEE